MRFAMLRNYLAFLRSHGVRWDDNAREVLWCGLSKVSKERRGRNAREREQDRRERERKRERFVTRERRSLRNRCPSGQKAFIVLFRSYGRRHKRGRPNSYGCRFCNVRVRSPIEKTDDHQPAHPPLSLSSSSSSIEIPWNSYETRDQFTILRASIPWNRGNQPRTNQR